MNYIKKKESVDKYLVNWWVSFGTRRMQTTLPARFTSVCVLASLFFRECISRFMKAMPLLVISGEYVGWQNLWRD
jgi:hypothetical protein